MSLQTVETNKGLVLAGPFTQNQRKRWIRDNLEKIKYLTYVIINVDGKKYTLNLNGLKKKAEAERRNNMF